MAPETRKLAYHIVVQLAQLDMRLLVAVLMECIQPVLQQVTIPTNTWHFKPQMNERSEYGYAGIKNLGSICYMNAMLQQFYMTSTFRYALLAADDGKEPALVEWKGYCNSNSNSGGNSCYVDDNILHQIQKMFAFLESTDR